ncbi:hypothetical protein [Arthrobacter mobilis]|uniref:Uncharacterized protein n=1 Tax=Arthrobacter mobilis TaxID=2724944 RepID=A0A7X6K350_9MICC|nr:hypothetical protein [Arthrobacter mobilis]NKX53917.1 hypothetical protein [Arthrobacter mobilis]
MALIGFQAPHEQAGPDTLKEQKVRIADTSDQWWKNAVIYCVDVETYLDSDHDGIGDIAGRLKLAGYGYRWLRVHPARPRDGILPKLSTSVAGAGGSGRA